MSCFSPAAGKALGATYLPFTSLLVSVLQDCEDWSTLHSKCLDPAWLCRTPLLSPPGLVFTLSSWIPVWVLPCGVHITGTLALWFDQLRALEFGSGVGEGAGRGIYSLAACVWLVSTSDRAPQRSPSHNFVHPLTCIVTSSSHALRTRGPSGTLVPIMAVLVVSTHILLACISRTICKKCKSVSLDKFNLTVTYFLWTLTSDVASEKTEYIQVSVSIS